MKQKGRRSGAPRGKGNGNVKLTAADVESIRWDYEGGGVTQIELAEKHNVSAAHINRIIKRKYWKHVT